MTIDRDGQFKYLQDGISVSSSLNSWNNGCIRLVVADGMGGHKNGRIAAETLVKSILKVPFQSSRLSLREHILNIHTEMFERYFNGINTPGSTLVMADIQANGTAVLLNVGDSRAYIQRNQEWRCLTHDHTKNEFYYRDNLDKYCPSQDFRDNHMIAQAVGFGSSGVWCDEMGGRSYEHNKELRIDIDHASGHQDIVSLQLSHGDRLMLCSDGFWEPFQGSTAKFNRAITRLYCTEHKHDSLFQDNWTQVNLLFSPHPPDRNTSQHSIQNR